MLAARMNAAHLSQRGLSLSLGIDQGAISRWLAGDRVPGLTSALKLQAALQIPVEVWSA